MNRFTSHIRGEIRRPVVNSYWTAGCRRYTDAAAALTAVTHFLQQAGTGVGCTAAGSPRHNSQGKTQNYNLSQNVDVPVLVTLQHLCYWWLWSCSETLQWDGLLLQWCWARCRPLTDSTLAQPALQRPAQPVRPASSYTPLLRLPRGSTHSNKVLGVRQYLTLQSSFFFRCLSHFSHCLILASFSCLSKASTFIKKKIASVFTLLDLLQKLLY